ncbi:MAG: RagB/SusD family nutrient uptake outer membrane protein [Bacillati bacterium ANGP1]|uniref:RagB/SusD family nutrient uptake outer membrane protein n=1 Tax=Candidatus Segetimicrobium genomatis TaxID=2569760 RepID=A0A537IXC5_9BACT|nr:MAG: RagB/SusD family nutrient uptake outer membrane protein [Terrabacteria group bacterium ANGP1]
MKTLVRYRLLSWTALVLLVAAAAYSCKDYLTVPSQGTLDEVTLATKAGVEGTLIAAYRTLDCTSAITGGAWGCAASNWVWGSVAADDSYKGSDPTDQPPIADIELYNWGTANAESYLDLKWKQVYEGVVRANATLRLLKKVLAEHPGLISPSDANGIKGEALFLRAHYHFEAWRMWKNIPYYTEDDQNYFKPNNVDPIPLILADLNAAIALLPDKPRDGEVGRVTSWTAKAYKGRVQVHTGDYTNGLVTLRDVQANGPYKLEVDFHHVWTGVHAFANGPETILAYEASANDGDPNGGNANFGERLNFPNTDPFCCGFNQPSQNLVNFFVVNDSGLPLAVTDPTWNTSNATLDSSATVPVDPRLDWTVGRDGVPYKDWGNHEPSWIRNRPYAGPYSVKKNVHEKSSGAQSQVGWVSAGLNSVHIHIFRYADLLLELAEAEVEAGVPDNARIIVNQIRARAGVVAQGPGTSATDIAVPMVQATPPATVDSLIEPWARYKIGQYTTPWTQAFARTAVRIERRLELAMEGQRFFDLRRWNVADTAINNYVAVEKTRRPYKASAATFTARHSLYPLPAIQIQLSKVAGQNTLVQNTGW